MKIHLISLGCDKNLVDSEKMLARLFKSGFEYSELPEDADIIIVNSCAFIGDAKEESINTILEMASYKEEGICKGLIVTGCLAERYRDEVLTESPEVDAVIGTNAYQDREKIARRLCEDAEACGKGAEKENKKGGIKDFKDLSEIHFREQSEFGRIVTTGGWYAYLKIAEGCNKRCTYCIIPYLRGPQRSVPMEELCEEARELADTGVRELILVAQETTVYGTDLYGKKMLQELLRRLSEIEGIKWIRLLYCYPEEITDELIEAIKDLPKVCHYLDIPIQHASDNILKNMARKTTEEEIRERIESLRRAVPDIALRTTMITGFPGETDEDFEILYSFVDDMEFDRLGVFPYSREEGTKAASFDDQVPEEIKEKRRDELMLLQQSIAFEKAEERVGEIFEVLIEGRLTEDAFPEDDPLRELFSSGNDNIYIGRTYMDAPSVDGYFFVRAGKRELLSGDFVTARVTKAQGYDLVGELV